MPTLADRQSLNNRLMQLLSSASAALQKPDTGSSSGATSGTFGAPLTFVMRTTARHNLATSFTRALSEPKLTTTRNSHSHHARPNLRPNVLCIRSTMSNSQRTRRRLSSPIPLSISFFLQRSTNRSWQQELVELNGIEPMTSCLQSRRSPN